MTSMPTGESGQQHQQRPSQQKESVGSSDPDHPRDPSARDIMQIVGLLFGGVVLVAFAIAYVVGHSAAGIEDRARTERVIRIELGSLPPYPGSVLIDDPAINTWDKPVSVDGTYSMAPGTCRSVQSYYTTVAPQHGWQITRPLTAGSDQGTTLSTIFGKTVGSNGLEMIVECRDGDGFYDVGIHS